MHFVLRQVHQHITAAAAAVCASACAQAHIPNYICGETVSRFFNLSPLTFCGASGCVVALRLPDAQLGRKGLLILPLLLLLLVPGSCDADSAETAPELLAAWLLLLLLSNVEGRPLLRVQRRRQSRACSTRVRGSRWQEVCLALFVLDHASALLAQQTLRCCICRGATNQRAHTPVKATLLPVLQRCQELAGCWKC